MHLVGVTDLYTAGLGAEIAGAVLLAKGVLLSPEQLYARSRSHYDFNPPLVIGMCEDRVDALFGVGGISLGFATQLAGYMVSLTVSTPAHGGSAVAVAVGLALAATALVVVPWRFLRGRFALKQMVRVTRVAVPPGKQASFLAAIAQTLGAGRTLKGGRGEGNEAFVERVFGVKVEPEDPKEAFMQLPSGQHLT